MPQNLCFTKKLVPWVYGNKGSDILFNGYIIYYQHKYKNFKVEVKTKIKKNVFHFLQSSVDVSYMISIREY